jgi:hypothetical protein
MAVDHIGVEIDAGHDAAEAKAVPASGCAAPKGGRHGTAVARHCANRVRSQGAVVRCGAPSAERGGSGMRASHWRTHAFINLHKRRNV